MIQKYKAKLTKHAIHANAMKQTWHTNWARQDVTYHMSDAVPQTYENDHKYTIEIKNTKTYKIYKFAYTVFSS